MAQDSVGATLAVRDFVKITPTAIHQWQKYRDFAVTAVGTVMAIPTVGNNVLVNVEFVANDGTHFNDKVLSNTLTKIT